MSDVEERLRRAEAQLATISEDDWFDFAMIAFISFVGVWIMTAPSKRAREADLAEAAEDYAALEEAEDYCALCGEWIDPRQGSTFVGPRTQRRLGLAPGDPICRRCARTAARPA